jgi:hypothetical protein
VTVIAPRESDPTSFFLDPDHPATTEAQDRLGVVPFVRRLVRPLLLAPKESSLVVGLCGPWGYGKSSALNFLEEALCAAAGGQTTTANVHLPQPIVVRFTPWLYGSVETLLASFFETLAIAIGDQPDGADDRSQRKTTLKALGEFIAQVAKVGAMFLPIRDQQGRSSTGSRVHRGPPPAARYSALAMAAMYVFTATAAPAASMIGRPSSLAVFWYGSIQWS